MRALPSRRSGVLLNTFTRAYLALVIGRPVVTLLLLPEEHRNHSSTADQELLRFGVELILAVL